MRFVIGRSICRVWLFSSWPFIAARSGSSSVCLYGQPIDRSGYGGVVGGEWGLGFGLELGLGLIGMAYETEEGRNESAPLHISVQTSNWY